MARNLIFSTHLLCSEQLSTSSVWIGIRHWCLWSAPTSLGRRADVGQYDGEQAILNLSYGHRNVHQLAPQ